MDAYTGYGHMIPQRRLPAGRHAPRHALPHTSRPFRDPQPSRTRPPQTGGERLHIKILGVAATADRLKSPESPRREDPNAASPRGQFTLSYRLLPSSGRTPVWSAPKMRSPKCFEPYSARDRLFINHIVKTVT